MSDTNETPNPATDQPTTPAPSGDPLDALDNLVPKAPVVTDDLTPEEKAAILAARSADVAPTLDARKRAADACEAADAAFEASPSKETFQALISAAKDFEALGLPVDFEKLLARGEEKGIALEVELDLDASPDAEPEPDEAPTALAAEPDPLELRPGFVPVYNPSPAPVDLPYSGHFYTVRAQGVDFVHEQAANAAVGLENTGGTHFKMGVRRLYGPEPRFVEVAADAGLTLEDWCRRRNAGLILVADKVYGKIAPQVAEELEAVADDIEQQ